METLQIKSTGGYSRARWITRFFITIAVIGFLWACKKTTDTSQVDCSGAPKTFSSDVKPIMQVSCSFDSDCHGSGSNSGPGSLQNYSEVFNARLSIRSVVLSGAMPKNGSLTAVEKSAIICWIDNGAPNN